MNEGLLFPLDKDITFKMNIIDAVRKYQTKMGHMPTCIHVRKEDDEGIVLSGMAIVEDNQLQPGHIWIGKEKK